MIPYETYKVLHILGVLLAFAALGAPAHRGQWRHQVDLIGRRLVTISHGVATFIILLGGFGALARLGVLHGNLPGWVLVKLACWVVLAVLVAIPYRKPALARPVFWFLPVLGGVAVVMAIYKPF
jgi:hypothetical protein